MTNTAQHTPGPWHYEESSNCDSVFVVTDDFGTQLAEVERWNSEESGAPQAETALVASLMAEAEANARLVAASPDLLAFAALWKSGRGTPRMLADMANAALSKARGE